MFFFRFPNWNPSVWLAYTAELISNSNNPFSEKQNCSWNLLIGVGEAVWRKNRIWKSRDAVSLRDFKFSLNLWKLRRMLQMLMFLKTIISMQNKGEIFRIIKISVILSFLYNYIYIRTPPGNLVMKPFQCKSMRKCSLIFMMMQCVHGNSLRIVKEIIYFLIFGKSRTFI